MRVLIVNRALGTFFGGGEAFDLGAARALAARGHTVTVLSGRAMGRASPHQFDAGDVSFVYLRVPSLRRLAYATERRSSKVSAAFYHLDNWLFERRAYSWLTRNERYGEFDIVQCCAIFRLPARVLRRRLLPVVTWLPGPPSGRKRTHLRSLLARPGFAVFARGATCNELSRRMGLVPGMDFSIIEPGIDVPAAARSTTTTWRTTFGIPEDVLLGVTVARLIPVKRLEVLVDAVAAAAAISNVHWVVLGDGPERARLATLAASRGVAERVHFFGHAARSLVHECLATADVFALTSRYESFSIATLEAMSHQVPVILPDVGYLPDLVRRSGGGIVVPPGDAKALARAIVMLDRDRAQSARLGTAGRRFAEEFAWPRIAEKLEVLYDAAAASLPGGLAHAGQHR